MATNVPQPAAGVPTNAMMASAEQIERIVHAARMITEMGKSIADMCGQLVEMRNHIQTCLTDRAQMVEAMNELRHKVDSLDRDVAILKSSHADVHTTVKEVERRPAGSGPKKNTVRKNITPDKLESLDD